MRDDDRLFEFIYSGGFLKDVEDLLDEGDLHDLEDELLGDPRRGRTIPGTGGFRKILIGVEGRGKRGGARVIYYFMD